MIGALIAVLLLLGAGLVAFDFTVLGVIFAFFAFNLLLLSILIART